MVSESDVDYRVKLIDASQKIRKVKVNLSVSLAHEVAMKKGPVIYPIRRVKCKNFITIYENPSLQKDNIFNGLVPKSFIFGLVKSTAFNSGFKKNSFNCQHFDFSSLGILQSTVNDCLLNAISFLLGQMHSILCCTSSSHKSRVFHSQK